MNVNLNHIAALAALELTPAEAEAMRRDLALILEYVGQLQRLDTVRVAPMAHVGALLAPQAVAPVDTLREDRARPSLDSAAALGNAPASAQGMFVVPKIVERG